jgi:hypothetical protein
MVDGEKQSLVTADHLLFAVFPSVCRPFAAGAKMPCLIVIAAFSAH